MDPPAFLVAIVRVVTVVVVLLERLDESLGRNEAQAVVATVETARERAREDMIISVCLTIDENFLNLSAVQGTRILCVQRM